MRDAFDLFERIDIKIAESYQYEWNGEKGDLQYFAEKYHKSIFRMRALLKQGLQFDTVMHLAETVYDDVLEYGGVQGTLKQLCKQFKKNYKLMKLRVYDNGMSIDRAFAI